MAFQLLRLVPWIPAALMPSACARGIVAWLSMLHLRWNLLHDGSARLYQSGASAFDERAAVFVGTVLIAQAAQLLVVHRCPPADHRHVHLLDAGRPCDGRLLSGRRGAAARGHACGLRFGYQPAPDPGGVAHARHSAVAARAGIVSAGYGYAVRARPARGRKAAGAQAALRRGNAAGRRACESGDAAQRQSCHAVRDERAGENALPARLHGGRLRGRRVGAAARHGVHGRLLRHDALAQEQRLRPGRVSRRSTSACARTAMRRATT